MREIIGCVRGGFLHDLSSCSARRRQVKISGYSIVQWVKKWGTTFVHRERCLIFAE